jgi:hypothetical protein
LHFLDGASELVTCGKHLATFIGVTGLESVTWRPATAAGCGD